MMKDIKDKKGIDRVFEFVGLQNAKGQFGGFSMGMKKQRLGIAGAMLGNPEIITSHKISEFMTWKRDLWIAGV